MQKQLRCSYAAPPAEEAKVGILKEIPNVEKAYANHFPRPIKLLSGNADIHFNLDDLKNKYLLRNEFEERNTGGSHRIFTKISIEGIISLQKTNDGKAKPYQVKQVRDFFITNKIIACE